MALVPYQEEVDIFFPGVSWLARNIHYFDPTLWTSRLWQYFLQSVTRAATDRLAIESRELGRRVALSAADHLRDVIARGLEATRWAFVDGGRRLGETVAQGYSSLTSYYRDLGLNPPQRRQLYGRLGLEDASSIDSQRTGLHSGTFVSTVEPPGGAGQRHCYNWLLPLVLGVYDESWGGGQPEYTVNYAQGNKAKGSVKRKSSSASSKTPSKRRRRSTSSKNRS
uniref:Minor capsid protein VP2 n=1 Tax=Lemniscomys rat polyomavirus TaxID=3141921 RepID=A0AAU7E2Y7_9POLY